MSKPTGREPTSEPTAHEKLRATTLKFIDIINSGDAEALMAHQTEDFTFIDMTGEAFHGRQGWHDYFSDYPDYRIHVDQLLVGGEGVAIIGTTTGSHVPPEVEEHERVLWTAEIRGGLVADWRIYANIEEARKKAKSKE